MKGWLYGGMICRGRIASAIVLPALRRGRVVGALIVRNHTVKPLAPRHDGMNVFQLELRGRSLAASRRAFDHLADLARLSLSELV